MAYHSHANARYFIDQTKKSGEVKIINSKVFNEVVVQVSDLDTKYQQALEHGILPGLKLDRFFPDEKDKLLVAFTEKRSKREIQELLKVLGVS